MRALTFIFLLSLKSVLGQESVQITFDTLYSIPGNDKPRSLSDLSAKTEIRLTADSLIFFVEVSDNELRNEGDAELSDRVEIWFGYPWLDFADFIIGRKGKETRIFRNTAEAGDYADVSRFLKDGDYPTGELIGAENSKPIAPEVPDRGSLKREIVFSGLVRLLFRVDGSEIIHANREKYSAFEQQTGYKLDDLSKYVSYSSRKTTAGYEMEIRMSNKCLGFARPEFMDKIRFALDVYDVDSESEKQKAISTAKNRYYARSFYMNEINLPFKLNVDLPDFPSEMISSLKINQDAVYTTQGWKGFGISLGNIVYAKDFISETGLQEFYFYKADIQYSKLESPFKIERVDITYDDLTIFKQHEVYLKVGENIISGKKYRYNGLEKNSFFYEPKKVSDSSFVIAVYDYEAVDPLGFGEFGHTADEFVYIVEIGPKSQNYIFNSGHRLEAANTIIIGKTKTEVFSNLKSVKYAWQKESDEFKISLTGLDKSENRTIVLRRAEDGEYKF